MIIIGGNFHILLETCSLVIWIWVQILILLFASCVAWDKWLDSVSLFLTYDAGMLTHTEVGMGDMRTASDI